MGHDGVASSYMTPASGYMTPTSFRRLTGCQRDPRDRGVTIMDFDFPRAWVWGCMHAREGVKQRYSY